MGDSQESFIGTSKPTRRASTRYWPCLVVSTVVSVMCAIGLVVYLVMTSLSHPLNESKHGQDNGTVCFSCDELGSSMETSDTLYDVLRYKGHHTLCCLRKNNQLNGIFRQMVTNERSRLTNGHARRDTTVLLINALLENKIGLHMFLDSKALKAGVLAWVDNSSKPEVVYQKGKIILHRPGRYLIYSHITFGRKLPDTKGGPTFVHAVTRYHPKQPNLGEVDILVGKNSYPRSSPYRSSFLTAVLIMRRGDQLAVRVSETDSIHEQFTFSYFGVIKI